MAVIEHCLTDERRWTVAELSAHSGISALTVFHIQGCIYWGGRTGPNPLQKAKKKNQIKDILKKNSIRTRLLMHRLLGIPNLCQLLLCRVANLK